jgi:hypothetical protein
MWTLCAIASILLSSRRARVGSIAQHAVLAAKDGLRLSDSCLLILHPY